MCPETTATRSPSYPPGRLRSGRADVDVAGNRDGHGAGGRSIADGASVPPSPAEDTSGSTSVYAVLWARAVLEVAIRSPSGQEAIQEGRSVVMGSLALMRIALAALALTVGLALPVTAPRAAGETRLTHAQLVERASEPSSPRTTAQASAVSEA